MRRHYWTLMLKEVLNSAARVEGVVAVLAVALGALGLLFGSLLGTPTLSDEWINLGSTMVILSALAYIAITVPARMHDRMETLERQRRAYEDAFMQLYVWRESLWQCISKYAGATWQTMGKVPGEDWDEAWIARDRAMEHLMRVEQEIATGLRDHPAFGPDWSVMFRQALDTDLPYPDTRDWPHESLAGDRDYERGLKELSLLLSYMEEVSAWKSAIRTSL